MTLPDNVDMNSFGVRTTVNGNSTTLQRIGGKGLIPKSDGAHYEKCNQDVFQSDSDARFFATRRVGGANS